MKGIVYAILLAALVGIVLGPLVIPVLKVLKFGQNVREDGPRSHLQKSGTPTMGGILIIVSLIAATLLVNRSFNDTYAAAKNLRIY
jgi:phospho-N-acetylmuramoyl-pentapeptide-transferase